MKSKKITLFIIVIVFIFILIYIKTSENNLIKKGELCNAKTIEWVSGAKMGLSLQYEFMYKKTKLTRSNAFGSIRGNKDFENRYFPVIYDPESGISQLLIEPSDYERFNLKFPDSLKWVLPYLNK